jgi:predicted methyltransferase
MNACVTRNRPEESHMRRPIRAVLASLLASLLGGLLIAAAGIGGAAAQLPPPPTPPGPYVVPANVPANIRRAIASAERTDEMRIRDYYRKPAELLALAAVEEGDRIIEIASVGQYFTTLLVEAVGPRGHVDMYDLPYTEQFGGPASRAFDAKHENASFHQQDFATVSWPRNVDAVHMVLYYHDLRPNGVDTAALNRKLFDALKPGGIYLIVDHKAENGSGWRDAGTIHRIGVETIEEEVLAAGFELALESDLLANPRDDRSTMVFAPGERGTTDQAVFLFRKPAGN